MLSREGAAYALDVHVAADFSAFAVADRNITLDLGGHTVTYDNLPRPVFVNNDFSAGMAGWSAGGNPPAVVDARHGFGQAKMAEYTDQGSGEVIAKLAMPARAMRERSAFTATWAASTSSAGTAM